MKSTKFTKVITAASLAAMMAVTAIPFAAASASTLRDENKTIEFTVDCDKQGYEFTVYKVADLEATSDPYKIAYDSLVDDISDEILSGKTASVLSALDGIDEMPSTAEVVGTFSTSAASTSKTFENLDQGMYYIKATNFPAGVKSVTNSVLALPYYSDGEWVYDYDNIELAEKVYDEAPATHKEITNSTKNNVNFTDISLGDTVNFEIRSTTTGSLSMKLNSYTVSDEMSAGLTLDKDSFNVALLDEDGNKLSDVASDNYKVTVTNEGDGEETNFNVALTKDYLQQDDFYASDVFYTSVTYSATLNKHAVVGKDGNPNTESELVYSNKNDVTDSVDGNTVYVYTFAVTTNKTDTDGSALAGAEFSLFKSETDAQNLENAIATGTSDSEGKVAYYNENGEEMRLASGTYYIVETAAPENYNVYGKVIPIDIDVEYGDTFVDGSYITNCPENGTASVDVKDTKVVVPQTGGAGTVMFYVIGAACALVGAAVVFTAKRKAKKNG